MKTSTTSFTLPLTCQDLRLVKDAVLAGVGHEDVGRVLLAGLDPVPQQGDFVVVDDVNLADGWPDWRLHLWDLVVVHIRLRMKRGV